MANKSLFMLCEAILEDHFGHYVKCVAHELLNNELNLMELRKALRGVCRQADICRAIATMELHNLITFKLTNRGVFYEIVPDNILRFIHLPRAIHIIQHLYGDLGAKIIKELAFYGRASYEKCISLLVSTSSDKDCNSTFFELASGQIVRKCDVVISSETGFPIMQKHPSPFVFSINVRSENTEKTTSRKRKHEEDTADTDLWCINWDRIEHYLHNESIFNLIRNHKDYNPNDEILWRSLLLVADSRLNSLTQQQSDPITVVEVCRYAKQNYNKQLMSDEASITLSKFDNTSDFPQMNQSIIRKSAESSGGLFTINYAAAVEAFCNEHVESVLRERIDDRAVRIFRLLRMRTNIEEELLPKMAMLAPKEAKEICYLMLENGYIFSRALARTNDFAPARSFYFYSYKFPELISNMTSLCCDSLRNVILRRLHEVKQNKILLDSRQKIEQIVSTINANTEISDEDKAAQAEEVEGEYMTEQDNRDYQRHLHGQHKFREAEIGISEVLFVFQLGRMFNSQKTLLEAAQKTKRRKTVIEI